MYQRVCDQCRQPCDRQRYWQLTVYHGDADISHEDTVDFCSLRCLGVWAASQRRLIEPLDALRLTPPGRPEQLEVVQREPSTSRSQFAQRSTVGPSGA